jgi:hypothetical protein
MDDPFLLAHIIRPFFFDIGGKLSPVSIRDQMIRGRMIIDRAYERGIITGARAIQPAYYADDTPESNSDELLIIGAGAAGVTAALTAIGRGIKTTLIDTAPAPFLRQANCQSRWIDPTQYDWPANHWNLSHYHWKPPTMPLTWNPQYSHVIAASWHVLFNRVRQSHPQRGKLTVLYNTYAGNFRFPPHVPRVQADLFDYPSGVVKRPGAHFSMVVSCIGFGTEKSSVDVKYSSFRFRDTDGFERTDLGIKHPVAQRRVLISGGGDGALQDYLRIVTNHRSAKHIYNLLPHAVKSRIQDALYSAEDQAQRAYIWGYNGKHDHDVHAALHNSHQKVIDELWNNQPFKQQIAQALDNLIRQDVIDQKIEVTLVHRCEHFSNCYGLSRLLVLLLDKHLRVKYGIQSLRPHTVVTQVIGTRHSCGNVPTVCHGLEHEVMLGESYCWTRRGNEKPAGLGYFEVVIIRHGIDPPAFSFTLTTSPAPVRRQSNPRQILPYHAAS